MPTICAAGLNYRTAPLSLRERVAMSADAVADRLRQIKQRCQVPEVAMLSTCNRTEIYCLSDTPEKVAAWLNAVASGAAEEHIYRYRARDAIAHLFRVASGLDSQLMGESEITGQVKQFAELARNSGASGVIINRLMENALATAKVVRSSTDIGRHSLSYPALALRAAETIFPDVRQTAALFVGTGDMTMAGGTIFSGYGVHRLAVAGRSPQKTETVAARINAEAIPIISLPDALAEFDIIISATASQVPIIGKGAVESALKARRHRPMMFADLAVPRDLEPEIQTLPDVFVYHLDQFGRLADRSREARRTAAAQAETIIATRVDEFCRWLRGRDAVPRVRAYRADAEDIRRQLNAEAAALLAQGGDPAEVLKRTTERLTAKLTHLPTQWLLADKEDKNGPGAD